jgi:hypothetical protein
VGATVFFNSANELATLSNTFKVTGTPTDPTAVTLTITSPSNVVTTYTWPSPATLTHGTAGVFSKDIPCGEAGEWQYLWEGTNAASDATAGTWTVQETTVGKLYAPVEALKSRIGLAATDTVDDYELYEACFAASRAIEHACGRHFWRTATGTVRTVNPTGGYVLKLPAFHDLVSVSALATDSSGDGTFETTWLTSDYQLLPANPAAAPEVKPYTKVKAVGVQLFPLLPCHPALARDDRVQITGVWGWPAVPKGVKQGALILAEELFKLKDAPFGVAGFGDLGVVRVRENPKVAALIGPYKRADTIMLVG